MTRMVRPARGLELGDAVAARKVRRAGGVPTDLAVPGGRAVLGLRAPPLALVAHHSGVFRDVAWELPVAIARVVVGEVGVAADLERRRIVRRGAVGRCDDRPEHDESGDGPY